MFMNHKRTVTFVKVLAVVQVVSVLFFSLVDIEINDGYICIEWFGTWYCLWPDGYVIVMIAAIAAVGWVISAGIAMLLNRSGDSHIS